MSSVELSMVIPVRDEIDAVDSLVSRIVESLIDLDVDGFEVIFVDDGSTDGTADRLEWLILDEHRCRVIRLPRPLGKGDALAAGFEASEGHWVAMIDADLQESPEELYRLLDVARSGADLVTGWRYQRTDRWSRRISSWLYNRVVRCVGGPPLHDGNCGFKVLSRELALSLPMAAGRFRFMHLVASQWGYRVEEVAVSHRPRQTGSSHFGFSRAFSATIDLVTVLVYLRGQDRPGRSLLRWGILTGFPGVVILAFIAYLRLADGTIHYRYPLLVLGALLTLAGLQLILFGCLAEWFSGKSTAALARRSESKVLRERERLP